MASTMKYILVPLFIGASLFGFNATFITLTKNGLGDALAPVIAGEAAALNGAPTPFLRSYSGIGPIDWMLANMVSYFSALIDGDASWNVTLFYIWGMTQFAAGWTLLVLEAKRAANRGRIVSWIATVGLIFQNLTWTFTVPLYLSLHLLTSPVAKLKNGDGDDARRALFVYLWDLAMIPMAVTLSFVVPGILMSLPTLLQHSATTHYGWLAFWQPFPLWTILSLSFLHNFCYYALGSLRPTNEDGEPTTPGHGYMVAVQGVYQFGLALCVSTHIPIMLLTLAQGPGNDMLGHYLPGYFSQLKNVTFSETFIPYPWYAPPTVDATNYKSGDLAPLAVHLIHYDFYVGILPLLIWSMYLHQTTVKNPSLSAMLKKSALWFATGGPAAAALALNWDRDEVVREGEGPLEQALEGRKTK
ncbi:hypothetical protein GGR57DRAFT_495209 [Xylariaceae sp. FL1272]|nr:hypothetical protein GGR57DRAFT_495209 [Xylariaceae sp. FL1272]